MVAAGGKHRAELPEAVHDAPGVRDGVDAELGLRTVRGEPGDVDAEPREPTVGDGDLQLGGLSDDRGIGGAPRE